jgi:hypothetical protein
MIFSTVNKIPAFILEKLYILFQLLKERKVEYESFAGKVEDKQLKRTVLSLAQETNQYAIELESQIETMAGARKQTELKNNGDKTLLLQKSTVMFSREDDILTSCEISESKMITAYRNILNEPFLHDNLRKLIRCQLNGLIYAFMQLKLLNASMYKPFHR